MDVFDGLSPRDVRLQIATLSHIAGWKNAAIADALGVHRNTVSSALKRMDFGAGLEKAKGGGRPRKLDAEEVAEVVEHIKGDRDKTLRGVAANWNETADDDKKITPRTLKNVLNRAGLVYRRETMKPLLTEEHMKARYEFARLHGNDSYTVSRRYVWVDEKYFHAGPSVRGEWLPTSDPAPVAPTGTNCNPLSHSSQL
jgi:transposase